MSLKYATTSSDRRIETGLLSLAAYGFLRDFIVERSYSDFMISLPVECDGDLKLAGLPFTRRERHDRQRMDIALHQLPERAIHQPMPRHRADAPE